MPQDTNARSRRTWISSRIRAASSNSRLRALAIIAAEIGLPADNILFLSDIVGELDAAREAGLQTTWLVRPRDITADAVTISASTHVAVKDFMEIAKSHFE